MSPLGLANLFWHNAKMLKIPFHHFSSQPGFTACRTHWNRFPSSFVTFSLGNPIRTPSSHFARQEETSGSDCPAVTAVREDLGGFYHCLRMQRRNLCINAMNFFWTPSESVLSSIPFPFHQRAPRWSFLHLERFSDHQSHKSPWVFLVSGLSEVFLW